MPTPRNPHWPEILARLRRGERNVHIARTLGISPGVVSRYRRTHGIEYDKEMSYLDRALKNSGQHAGNLKGPLRVQSDTFVRWLLDQSLPDETVAETMIRLLREDFYEKTSPATPFRSTRQS